MLTDNPTPSRGGDGVVVSRGKRLAEAVSSDGKPCGEPRKKPNYVNRPCKSCKQLFKAESARGQKCQSCSQITKQMTVAPIGGQVENIDCDECMDTDMQTPSDILAFQLRRVIREEDREIQKKDKKLNNLRLWYSN